MTPEEALFKLECNKNDLSKIVNELDYAILSKIDMAMWEIENLYKQTKREIELFKAFRKSRLPQSAPPESKPPLPPVIQAVLNEGLLDDHPVNGKYQKKAITKMKKLLNGFLIIPVMAMF
jgi:hypothetical protein